MEENMRNEELQVESQEQKKKRKKNFGENEAPVWRWIVGAVLGGVCGALIGSVVAAVAGRLPFLQDGQFLAPERTLITGMLSFAGIYVGLCLGIRIFCKTRMRSFYFGSGRKADKKSMLIVGLLYLVGMMFSTLLSIGSISYAGNPASLILVNLLLCLLLVWIQTSTEEVIFRGFFLRIPYKNTVPGFPKGLFAAIISSLLFMAAHLYNPEVTSQSGLTVAVAASTYFITAMGMFFSNLVIGGMEGSLIIHFVNNFFCFFFLQAEVSALVTPTLFIDRSQGGGTAYKELGSLLVAYAPVMIYLVWRLRKQKREEVPAAASENAEDRA